ncbi:WD40 repeat domain-containing protein [Dapis sp. BLCC M229]|uniref:WD40 repeat domain-containing protein n=1 Tax=Dapis sp. BLCC M229 TaxID=3400188 RepID=UPI003CEE0416
MSKPEIIEIQEKNDSLITTIPIHYYYNGFSFSPDNQNLLIYNSRYTNYNYTPKLWNIDRREISLQQNTKSVKSISVSNNGKTIAAIVNNKLINLWNTNGLLIKRLEHDGIKSLSFSPDSKTIAVISNDNLINLWSSNGLFIKRLEHDGIKKLSFSPDSKTIVSTSKNRIKLWNSKGELIIESKGNYQKLPKLFFSPNSQSVAVISEHQVIFLSRNGKLINSFDAHNKKIEKIILSPDKQLIVTQSYNQVKLWNLNGKLIRDLDGNYQKVKQIIFSPESQIIASIGDDNFAKLWRGDGTYIGKLDHPDIVKSLDFSRGSNIIITLSYNKDRLEKSMIKLWKSDGTPMKPYKIYDYGINNIKLHPDGKVIASTSGNFVKLWNRNGKLITILKGHYEDINDVKFSPDGEIIATASKDQTIKLWRSKDGKEIKTLKGHKHPVQEIVFSPDGNIFASISPDGKAIAVQNQSGVLLLNADLDDLLNRACNWASAYLKTTDDESIKHLCD